jgi:hypothetical protein
MVYLKTEVLAPRSTSAPQSSCSTTSSLYCTRICPVLLVGADVLTERGAEEGCLGWRTRKSAELVERRCTTGETPLGASREVRTMDRRGGRGSPVGQTPGRRLVVGWARVGLRAWLIASGGRRERGRRPEVSRPQRSGGPQRSGPPAGAPKARRLTHRRAKIGNAEGTLKVCWDRGSHQGLVDVPITFDLRSAVPRSIRPFAQR